MGNHSSSGHALNLCGCTDAFGFEGSASTLIYIHDIKPWNARSLIRANLQRQAELAKRSPLKSIHVDEGLRYIGGRRSSFFNQLTRKEFVQATTSLLLQRGMQFHGSDQRELEEVFDSMDFDKNGSLDIGEWAGGLSVFFRGTQEDCVNAVFKVLDGDLDGRLSKKELQEYLKPFVKAMSPSSADSLRPLLVKKCVDDLYMDVDFNKDNQISPEELLDWTRRGNSIIDRLADIIDKEVQRIWLKNHMQNQQGGRAYPADYMSGGGSPYGGAAGGPPYGHDGYHDGQFDPRYGSLGGSHRGGYGGGYGGVGGYGGGYGGGGMPPPPPARSRDYDGGMAGMAQQGPGSYDGRGHPADAYGDRYGHGGGYDQSGMSGGGYGGSGGYGGYGGSGGNDGRVGSAAGYGGPDNRIGSSAGRGGTDGGYGGRSAPGYGSAGGGGLSSGGYSGGGGGYGQGGSGYGQGHGGGGGYDGAYGGCGGRPDPQGYGAGGCSGAPYGNYR